MTSLDWNSLKNTCLKTGENIPLTIDEIHAQSLALNPSASVPATTASFSLLSATERTDINVWINHSIDSIIIDSINNVADRARKNAKIHLSQLVDSLWDTQKSRFLSELLAPSHSRRLDRDFMLVQKTGLTPRMKSYAALISSLNKSNLKNIFKKMASGLKDLVTDASLGQILDCWNLGSCLFEQNSTVVEGGRRFLGDQFFKFVDSSLTKERVELGGLPSVNSIIEAFINLKFKKYGQWTRSYLIIDKNGKAIWAHLFYLLRSCKYEESILYAESNSASFAQTDPNFIGYLKSFLTSSFMIPKRARDTLLLFWNNNIRTKISVDARGVWNGGDPFLVACYKIVGRCEVAKRTIPGADIHPTTEDYLWFQLMLIREASPQESSSDKFTLSDFSKTMKSYGINHFCPNGRQPVLWAIILLLCGDYTTAIAYLHSTSFQTDAVHLAIALTHYQKLNISHTGDELFRTKNSTGDSVVVDISMLIYSYASKFSVSNSHEAIQYILILGNIKDSDPSISYSAIACNYLVNIICENIDKIDNLVGAQGSDGTTRSTGYIEQHGKLVDITSSSQFVSNILSPAAEKCDSEGRVLDAVLLFDRAGEYSHVFLLLSRKLGELVSMFHIPCPLTPQIGKKEALIITAKEYYQKYTIKCPSILRKIQNSTVKAVSTLLTMYDFLDLVCRGSYSESLNLIDTIDIFPSNQRNLSDLDSSVASCIPLILVTLMDVLYVLFVETKKMVNRDGSARARMDEIKKRSGDLVLFCAGSRFKLTGDVYGRVVGVDADMV